MATESTIALPETSAVTETGSGSIFFVGNATVLIGYAGFTFMTDPTFVHKHQQVELGMGLHATRLTDPAIDIGELPLLDFVLLSHFHGDHFDQVAQHELDRSLPVVTTPDAAKELAIRGFSNTHPLQTWSSVVLTKGDHRLRITATPARHGPPLSNLVMPDVMGSLLEFQSADGATLMKIYIGGDTLAIDDLKEIPQRFPAIDIGLLHLGGTKMLGILVTMDGKQGLQAMQMVDLRRVIPIHFDDYDVFTSPLSDFQQEVSAAGLTDRVHYLDRGDTLDFRVAAGMVVAAGKLAV